MKQKLTLILLSLIFCTASTAQTAVWKRFGANEGIPSTTIVAIAQSADGMMWFGSQNGLISYDGAAFKKIDVGSDQVQPYIESIVIDKRNVIWIGARSGLWSFRQGDSILTHHKYEGNSPANIQKLCLSADSTLLFAATYDGTVKIDISHKPVNIARMGTGRHHNLTVIGNSFYILIASAIVRFNEKSSDTIHTGPGARGMCWYEKGGYFLYGSQNKISRIFPDGKTEDLDLGIDGRKLTAESAFFVDRQNRIWINTNEVLYCFTSPEKNKAVSYRWDKENDFTMFPGANFIFHDKQDNIWVGMSGYGCVMLGNRAGKINFISSPQLSATAVWSILHDKSGHRILYGTSKHVVIYDYSSATYQVIPPPLKTNRFTVTGLLDFDNQNWLVTSYGSSAWLLNKTSLKFSQLPGMKKHQWVDFHKTARLDSNRILMSAISGLYCYQADKQELLPYHEQNSVLWIEKINNDSQVYSTTYGIGFISNNKKTHYAVNQTKDDHTDIIFSVCQTKNKRLFAATMKGGVFEFDLKTRLFNRVKLAGNPSIAYCFGELNDSCLLITSNNGLILYNHYLNTSKTINKTNGLPFNDFDQFGLLLDDEFFIGSGPEGAVLIDRKNIEHLFYDEIDLGIRYNQQPVNKISIPAGYQSLNATAFAGVNYNNASLHFQYTMEGLEEEWHNTESANEISYNYLPPGNYILKLKVSDPNNIVSSKQISIPVIVLPLWYQTIWFKVVLVLIASTALISAVRYISWLKLKWKLRKLEAEQKVASERMRISRELHDNVGSQLTYLITGLEASEMMLRQEKTQNLNTNLEQLQQSARDSMQQLRDSIWALNNEEMTISTLAERFKNWVHKMLAIQQTVLRFETDIDNDITLDAIKALNLFRLLQETINNAIKHAEASEIFVTILCRKNMISCQVHDNGKGFIESQSDGNGLNNMKTRAKELGGTISIESEPDSGTTITLSIPVNTLNG